MEDIQEKIAALNIALCGSMPFELAWVDPHGVELLEDNARYMRNDTFAQLVENIKLDKGLASVPLLYQDPAGGKLKVLSGNHRVMAAMAAKLDGVLCLVIRTAKTIEEQVAIQLSHNSIVGADDLPKLKQLYERISTLTLKAYSGIDDETIQKLAAIKFEPVSEPHMTFKTVTFLFLPGEIDELAATIQHVEKLLESKDAFAFQVRDYYAFFELIAKAKEKLQIKNSAAAILELMRAGHRQIESEAALEAAQEPIASAIASPDEGIAGSDAIAAAH
ncbi:ParB N-terminal domain-containing protein [Nevskia soli]|uniref:ParB N-terminal domain-containing protein n=1 Tax=Nevskia soli TaxID=418856 RepID=UPI0015D6B384|nr:ParB N-terminal domain-containing protein [Nevskia soli]